MFTRRTATVTISAPDASTAAAFSSKFLYLPVPTISRERERAAGNGPVIGLDVLLRGHSTPSDEMHDLERVAVFDRHLIQNLSRDDLKVALDRDLARVEPQLTQHSSNAEPGRYSALLTVNLDRDTGVDSIATEIGVQPSQRKPVHGG